MNKAKLIVVSIIIAVLLASNAFCVFKIIKIEGRLKSSPLGEYASANNKIASLEGNTKDMAKAIEALKEQMGKSREEFKAIQEELRRQKEIITNLLNNL